MKAKKLIALILSVTLCITMLPERVLSQFIGAFSTSAYATSDDPYVDTFGITENQLYTTYPDYLSESFVMDKLREYNVEIIKIGNSGDSTTNTIIYSLGNGLSFLSTEAMAALGMGESTEEKVCDAVVKKIATELSRDESVSYSYLKTELSIIDIAVGKTFDLATAADVNRLEKELQKLPQISKEKANALVQQTKDNGSFMKASVNGAVTISELIIQAAEIESLNSQLLYDIFEYFEFNNQTELADAAWRLYKKSEEDFGKRMLDIYLTDAAANTFADIIKDTVMSSKVTMICSITYKMLELGKVVSDIKDILGANYSSIAASCAYYHMDKLLEKSKKQMLTDSEIEDYKFSYSLCNAALVTGFGYAKECAATKDLRVDASSYQAIVRGAFTYDKYIKGCMSLYKNAKDNGQLKTASYADSSKKVTTTITPEKSYENILERFQKIQSVYPPNAGVQYLAGGECFGFAKMVFFNLFGVSLPGCYLGSAKYEYTSSETVEIVGQLTGADVTVSNLADLFSKAKLGDIIQACGRDFEQHTMVFVNYSDKGLTLYDCNFRYTDASVEDYGSCFVHQRTYSLSEFAGWYDNVGTYDVANGVTLYHATNYEYIYGGEDVIFYDDSVNFVISDGVLTKYNGSQKYVEIPAEVTSIGANAFKNNDYIISVAFPDGLTSIGDNAFYDCDNLAAVVMPDSVTTIGNSAFDSCDNLGYLYLSSELTEIGRYAFANCASLTDFLLPSKISILNVGAFHNCDSITSISIPSTLNKAYTDSYTGVGGTKYYGVFSGCDNLAYAEFEEGCSTVIENIFYYCTGLKKVKIPDTVISVGSYAFYNCNSLTDVPLPLTVGTIGSYAFGHCSSLKNIDLPKSIREINEFAFTSCLSLTDIVLPSKLTTLGAGSFNNCDALTQIVIPSSLKNAYTDSYTGVGGTKYYGVFSGCDNLAYAEFEEGCSTVIENIFYYCTGLKKVKIPDTVISVGSYAFYNCNSLTDVPLPLTVGTIGSYAFGHCSSLKNIDLPKSIREINEFAFTSCLSLTDIVLPSKLTTLGAGSFNNCDALTQIVIPSSLKNAYTDSYTGVGGTKYYGVFSGCDNLEHATFSDKCTAVIDNIFFRCNGLKKVDIPNTVTSIGNRSFEECISLEQITIPESVTTIGSSAFYNCNSLTEIGIPDGVKVISKNTFYNCQSIKKVRLPNTITLINSRAFYNCDALVNIKIPENVIAIDDSAFNNCDSLTAIKMGNVKFIGSQAFYDCDALESVEISAVHSIGSEAFRDCDSLISIKLGEYVNTIGASAFRKLPKLTNISIPSPVASISDYAFAENVKLSDVHIPSSAVTISDTAFSYPDIMTIHAANGSAAATYADDWEFEFEPDDYDLSIKPTVSNIRPYSLTLTWDSVTGVDKYSVSYLDSNNIFRTAAEDISSTSYTITGLAQYTNYKVLVRGLKNGRCSDYTTSDFVSTRTAQGAGDITTLTAEPSETSVVLSWTSSSSANGYIIYQLDASGNWIEIARTNSSTRKYTVTGLVSGIKYTFAVCGYKNIGSEAVPGQKTQTTVATPDSTQVANCVGHSLTLTSGIGIKYYIEFSDQVKSDAGAYIKFTLPDSSTETHSVNIAETAIVNGKNVYVFTCNVSAAEMSDIIKTELILSSGDSVYLSDYSIKAYADHILANANSNEEFAKAAPVVKAMLNYGAYSQIFFKHNIDNLANSNMTDTALSNVTSSDISSYKYSVSDNDANIDFVGQVITLKSKVNAKLYFTTNNSAALTKEQVVIKQGSIAIDPSRIIIGTDESGMYISITDICVDDYDDAFEIAVGNVSIKNYSIYSYIYMALESKDINLINVARSLFDYNRAVETFAS